ncbi:cell division cycle- protein, partial [Cryomyces antarcticus]
EGGAYRVPEDSDGEEEFEEEYRDSEYGEPSHKSNSKAENTQLLSDGIGGYDQEEAAFWIPQATPDGRLFYFNTLTGVSTMELPLESPTSVTDSGPRDRINVFIPEQTRPPPELLAGGYERDDDTDYENSTSEVE